jgi:hypothetical protein
MSNRSLTAARVATATMATPSAELTAADAATRLLEGYAVTYHELGHTSAGPLRVRPGAIRLPADLRRVKLVDEHQNPPRSVGYMLTAESDDVGLRASFRVAGTTSGDLVLADYVEGARDALSVELADLEVDAQGYVTSALLTAVAAVTVPAFPSSRVDRVAASHTDPSTTHTEGTTHMLTDEQRTRLEALRAQDTLTQAEAVEMAELAALEAAVEEAPTPEEAAQAPEPSEAQASRRVTVRAGAARVPAGVPGTRTMTATRPVSELAAAMARVLTGQSRPELEAALANITNTANIWATQDAYAGELWSGVQYERRYVGLMSQQQLTSYKVSGWRWVVRPQVDDYAGDKAPVPSNSPTTEAVDVTAARLAGAHDIDRAHVDFGNTEFIASYYRAMTESYAVKSDRKARAAILANGAANVSATVGTSLWDALLIARLALTDYEDDDFMAGEPDYYLVNSSDLRGVVLGTTNADTPAFLGDLGITIDKLRPSGAVPAGAVIAGVRNAATFYELGEAPIRVEAINVANGGVDGGVFGYWASLRHHVKGTVRVNFA